MAPNLERRSITKCPRSCSETRYEIQSYEDTITYQGLNTSTLYFFYQTTAYEVQEEYLLYDFNSIIASVGGSLGLFLGFSCFQIARTSLKRLVKRLCYLEKNNSKDNDKDKDKDKVVDEENV